ncbi:MAG TPA: hypothetical protein VGB71_00660 [Flavisolibacter sp.]|jgi:hypothetical protein
MQQKIANITIEIPYKRAGNVIYQEPVNFDVYQDGTNYKLLPCLSDEEIRIANLPRELAFVLDGGHPISLRGNKDGNFHVIEDAVKALKEKQIFQ